MLCPRCGSDNVDGAQFCSRCWSALQAPVFGDPTPRRVADTAPGDSYRTAPEMPAAPQSPVRSYGWQQPGLAPAYQHRSEGASGRAIAAIILGAVSAVMWCPLLSIAAIVLGRIELKAIERGESPRAGETLARVAFVLGIIFTVISGLFVFFYGAMIVLWLVALIAAGA